jgi:hypothetical protein
VFIVSVSSQRTRVGSLGATEVEVGADVAFVTAVTVGASTGLRAAFAALAAIADVEGKGAGVTDTTDGSDSTEIEVPVAVGATTGCTGLAVT